MPNNQINKINPVLERMLEYLNYADIAPTKADKLMQSGNGRIGKMIANGTNPKQPFIENFLRTFIEVSREWLEKGEGQMIKITGNLEQERSNTYRIPEKQEPAIEKKIIENLLNQVQRLEKENEQLKSQTKTETK